MKEQDLILIHKYLRKELSSDEDILFQNKLSNDSKFRDRVNLENSIGNSLNKESWSFIKNSNAAEVNNYQKIFQNKETQTLRKTLEDVQKEYNSTKQRKSWVLYLTTAAVIILISTLLLLPKEVSNQELYTKYLNKTDLLALVDRGRTDSILSTSQVLFDEKDYSKVIDLLKSEVELTNNSNVFIYLAISQMESEKFDDAEMVIDKLISSNLLDAEKGYWYKSLLYLKSSKIDNSKKELQFIIENNLYNKDKAKELLEDLR